MNIFKKYILFLVMAKYEGCAEDEKKTKKQRKKRRRKK